MSRANDLVEAAFAQLAKTPGFVERQDQVQLSMLLADCIGSGQTGAFEAPTGLGKSLATLIPAIAQGLANGKRIAIATYTNILAEQYWRKDLPLALSLFDDWERLKPEFLIGRQRYACMASIVESHAGTCREFRRNALLGIETEFRQHVNKVGREMAQLWNQVSAPPVCPARLCPYYQDCYYYRARRSAEKANLIITNHNVVLQDAILRKASDDELSLLGKLDFVIFDEAHDLISAAQNALEFELSHSKLGQIIGIAQKLQSTLSPLSLDAGEPHLWNALCDTFCERLSQMGNRFDTSVAGTGQILRVSPNTLQEDARVKTKRPREPLTAAQVVATEISELSNEFTKDIDRTLKGWDEAGLKTEDARDTVRNYLLYLNEFAYGCKGLFSSRKVDEDVDSDYEEVGVTYTASSFQGGEAKLRYDVIGLNHALKSLVWDRTPWACLSATLAIDGNFDFFTRTTGAKADFEEILPSPFDFSHQAALYVPPAGKLIDPTMARDPGVEQQYYRRLADEIGDIIEACGGRTLALFHSRKEMEGVHREMALSDEFPILIQRTVGVATTGDKFKERTNASLFALRSFWTGFDAPGETLSCVILVRVPFEVPVDPPAIARMAWLASEGYDPFMSYTLPQAKMMMRQGAGRLIRTTEDRGVICLLDPRLRTKRYGEQIFENMPSGMRMYEDIHEAVARAGI